MNGIRSRDKSRRSRLGCLIRRAQRAGRGADAAAHVYGRRVASSRSAATFAALLFVVAVSSSYAQSPTGAVESTRLETALLEAARDGAAAGDMFKFVVEQGGRVVRPSDGEVVSLESAPFTLWVVFVSAPSVLVNVSTGTDLYTPIEEGLDLAEALPETFDLVMGMAEVPYNLDRVLFVLPLSAHYLEHPSAGEHRFNRAYWHREFAAGGRDVENLSIMSRGGDEYPIDRSPTNRLYVSGLYAPFGSDYSREVEDSAAFILEW